MKTLIAAMAVAGMLTGTANATSLKPSYMDDRSDAEALIRSYYNALVRKEYARAWSYFGDDKPVDDFEAFETRHADIDAIDLVFGEVFAEGAAGSVYYQVPVAVRVTHENGDKDQSAGCVTAKIVNPQIQGVPFQPMYILSSPLEEASGPLNETVPASCEPD